jgi:hypothetical protein
LCGVDGELINPGKAVQRGSRMPKIMMLSTALWAGLLGLADAGTGFAKDAPAPPALSPQAAALIAPVHAAFAKVAAEQRKLPPPSSDREKLERMFDLDQAGRAVLVTIDFAKLPQDEQQPAQMAAWQEINAHDLADQAALKAMIPKAGWFLKSVYGAKAASAAFLIVQHAVNDPDLMRTTLRRMAPLVAKGEADAGDYGLMFDRVALEFDHKPQRYGSQVECKDGKWQPYNLEDPAHVDERRKALGFEQTEAEYLKNFDSDPCH